MFSPLATDTHIEDQESLNADYWDSIEKIWALVDNALSN